MKTSLKSLIDELDAPIPSLEKYSAIVQNIEQQRFIEETRKGKDTRTVKDVIWK